MSHQAGPSTERRRYLRIEPKGSVTLLAGGNSRRGRIVNLSHGGLLANLAVGAPERLLACTVDLELRLDGQFAQWLPASGRIMRIGSEGIAISFTTPPPGLARVIDEMSTASHARRRVMSMVLVDPEPLRRSVLAAAFRSAGCTVIETSTPLEAIVRLGELNFEPDLIAIADSTPSAIADDLRHFVVHDHPRVKLVTIGEDLVRAASTGRNWLSPSDLASDLARRVRQVLGSP